MSLFLWAQTLTFSSAQELKSRVKAESSPISVQTPEKWEAFNTDLADQNEILFLQTPEEAEHETTVSVSLYRFTGKFSDLVRKQNYHLLVWEEGPVLVNQALKLRGVSGHKWMYREISESGREQLYYRLYLLLPESVGERRLLFLQGVTNDVDSTRVLPLFNNLARSLSWGLTTEFSPSDSPE